MKEKFKHSLKSRFEEEFFHRFDEELSHKFEQELFKRFGKELSHMFEKKFFHMFEEGLSPRITEELLHEKEFKGPIRYYDKYQNLLYNLFISSFLFHRRRKRRFSIADLYMRLYYFYFIISRNVRIEEVKKFSLKF